ESGIGSATAGSVLHVFPDDLRLTRGNIKSHRLPGNVARDLAVGQTVHKNAEAVTGCGGNLPPEAQDTRTLHFRACAHELSVTDRGGPERSATRGVVLVGRKPERFPGEFEGDIHSRRADGFRGR